MAKGKLKLKTHKGAAKRFKLTGSGKVTGHHSHARHILTSKPARRKRRLARATTLSRADAVNVHMMLPYGK